MQVEGQLYPENGPQSSEARSYGHTGLGKAKEKIPKSNVASIVQTEVRSNWGFSPSTKDRRATPPGGQFDLHPAANQRNTTQMAKNKSTAHLG